MKKIKIAIDGRSLKKISDGISNYTYNFIKYLPDDEKIEWFIFSNTENIVLPPEKRKIKIVTSKFRIPKAWLQINVPFLLSKLKIDVFWEPIQIAPIIKIKGCKVVLTVHDLTYKYFPETMTNSNFLNHKLFFTHSLKSADLILTVSHSTKNDILKEFKFIDEKKIEIIYPAVDNKVFYIQNEKLQNNVKGFNLSDEYILTVGSFEPRKNLMSVLIAYEELFQKGVKLPKLIMVGGNSWKSEELFRRIENSPIKENIFILGYVSNDDLRRLYNNAICLIYPSLYEGFGLPPLEAMTCGCPVIASNKASLPEVCGDAALYIDPFDIETIKDAIIKISKNKELQYNLRIKGLKECKKFSWEESAKKLFDIFIKLAYEK
ncbi:glycosyltransferase family 4 protein [Carboxydothermus ferrireducens]|uniref:Glycosyltransferase involved in cell wall biosynthesis n=1 Tax=Carboxydothermus ferrireducens DSM 11255 TaxID=1119529 RepID=A0ABX2R7B0_9THEO|nr:glycosyltransferase family 1 protein [Carboxydothermus ferrireducens]NYE56940.1 glycosyltransferase involved in cell wall biosynthesis [Carboxydothermus ferrireducens DSM 11255]